MLFGRSTRRKPAPVARMVVTSSSAAGSLGAVPNGPDTPIMDVSAMRRALSHAAWRDPSLENRKNDDIRNAVRTLERTAACVDLALERLSEASETLTLGQASNEQVMRGLLTARFEELLDSLERVAILAQDGYVNLLAGGNDIANGSAPTSPVPQHYNGLSLDIGAAGFSYVLTPIDIRRGPTGLDIPVLEQGFNDDSETYIVETALLRAQAKLTQFGARLSHDAIMLVTLTQAHDVQSEAFKDEPLLSANDAADFQTECGAVA